MKIEFKSTIPAQPAEEIYIGDKKIGTIKQHVEFSGSPFHAAINLPGEISLIQGYGATREKAIQAALNKGWEDANKLLCEIAALQTLLEE